MATDLNKGFKLGPWRVEPLRGAISTLAENRRIEPKVMDVLVRLAEGGGDLVTRDELLTAVWGERAVSDEPLTRAIGELRRALGDSSDTPTYIETVPKRGYRLLVPVLPLPARDDTAAGAAERRAIANERLKTHHWAVIAAAAIVAVVAGLWWTTLDREAVIPSADVRVAVDEPTRPTVAVLPFCDLSGADSAAYFGQGLTEDLTTLLARSPELIVISNTSASQFACQPASLAEVGRELGARYLVSGSVRIAVEQMRLTARLVDTQPDQVVWSDSYERELSLASTLAVQADIARNIASSLEVEVMHLQSRVATDDPTAWELYARGRAVVRNPLNAREGRRLLERAVAADPKLAGAHAYLGQTYILPGISAWDPEVRSQLLAQGEVHIRRSLALDPNHHVGQGQLGLIYFGRRQPDAAMRAARRAMAAVPSYDVPYAVMGVSHLLVGDIRRARDAFEQALQLNPRPAPGMWGLMGALLYLQGDYSGAVELFERARPALPGLGIGPILLAHHYESIGRQADAQKVVSEILALYPDATATRGYDYLIGRMPQELIPEGLAENLRAAGLP